MRRRLSPVTRRRLELLEQTLAVGRPIGLWPKMLSCDEWEAIALPVQRRLGNDSEADSSISNANHA